MENISVFNNTMVLLALLESVWTLLVHVKGCTEEFSVNLHYEWDFCFYTIWSSTIKFVLSYVVFQKYFRIM